MTSHPTQAELEVPQALLRSVVKYLFTDDSHIPQSEEHQSNGGRETALESRTRDKSQQAYTTNVTRAAGAGARAPTPRRARARDPVSIGCSPVLPSKPYIRSPETILSRATLPAPRRCVRVSGATSESSRRHVVRVVEDWRGAIRGAPSPGLRQTCCCVQNACQIW